MSDSDDIDEVSLRERMDASEKNRIERRKEREQRKKDRRHRVERLIGHDNPKFVQNDKIEEYKNEIFEELSKREKLLEEKIRQMGNKITDKNDKQQQELENKIVNDFINKLAIENYNKLEEKIKHSTNALNNRINDIVIKNNESENNETKRLKKMFISLQNKMQNMEEDLGKKKDISTEEEIQYEELQKQIHDITTLIGNKESNNIITPDLEEKINQMMMNNVDSMYDKLNREIEMKMNKEKQDERINEILKKISEMENVKDDNVNDDNNELIITNLVEQITKNNDIKMKKMYMEIIRRINKINTINDDDKINTKETIVIDLERRLNDIENYKKKLERENEKKLKQINKQKRKSEKEKKSKKRFSKLKNKILKKHNLSVLDNDESSSEDEIEVKTEKVIVKKKDEKHPYMELFDKIKTRLPSKTLTVSSEKDIENLFRELGKKYERHRGKTIKEMTLLRNKLTREKINAEYSKKRGIIVLDDRENEIIKIFKRYNVVIKERFAKEVNIYFTYYHDFNFTFENTLTKETLSLYYDDNTKPNMVIFSYKTKYKNYIKKYRKTFKIGEFIKLNIKTFENKMGEHLDIKFLDYEINFNHMLRIMNIESNCFFEIELQYDDEELFDI